MSMLVYRVRESVSMNRTNINRISEVVPIPFLAEVYGYKDLENCESLMVTVKGDIPPSEIFIGSLGR